MNAPTNWDFPRAEAVFFEDPWVYREPPGIYGTLYLLRRDIHFCLGSSFHD